MINNLFPPLVLHYTIFTVFCVLIAIPSSYCAYDRYEACSHPYNFSCGSFASDISYPFWANERLRDCGKNEFKLTCEENGDTIIEFASQAFRVLHINTTDRTVTISRKDISWESTFCPEASTVSVNFNQFLSGYSSNVRNFTFFYDCTDKSLPGSNNYTCQQGSEEMEGFYTIDDKPDHYFQNLSDTCSNVTKVPILFTDALYKKKHEPLESLEWLRVFLDMGLEVKYEAENGLCSVCQSSGGICGSNDLNPGGFACLCRDKSHPHKCPGNTLNLRLKITIGTALAIIPTTIICIIICLCRRKKISSLTSKSLLRNLTKNDQDIEAFIRDYGTLAPKRYNFSDVKKITNSFKEKLGQGGYGGVYKGKLSDGHLVAVKLLNTSTGNGGEFINEVASISRTSHINVVTLLGFCLEGDKRALIYEFMSNGSLEKFIDNGHNLKASQYLGWEKMYEIAVGVARGLEYLHRGCNTRILHFDIKPHNILLDKDFCPKISDFGLAKLCLNKESIVSMLEAKGTIGYIAPEVFSRTFGEVSSKSDVYSYGMMILEIIGGRKNQDVGEVNTSEKYFPHWIYKHVEQDKELKWHGVNSSEENEIAKKMIIVGLWCIQMRPSDRPSMSKVVEMLQGSVEALPIPPEPFFSSSPRLPIYSSTTSMS